MVCRATITRPYRHHDSVPPSHLTPANIISLWVNRYEDLSSTKPTTPIEYKPIAKRMKESYVEEYLPFKSDLHVKEEYIDIYGKIRVGKLFEDLDALAEHEARAARLVILL